MPIVFGRIAVHAIDHAERISPSKNKSFRDKGNRRAEATNKVLAQWEWKMMELHLNIFLPLAFWVFDNKISFELAGWRNVIVVVAAAASDAADAAEAAEAAEAAVAAVAFTLIDCK